MDNIRLVENKKKVIPKPNLICESLKKVLQFELQTCRHTSDKR